MHHWLALLFSSHYFHKIYITVNQFPATCEPIVRVECRKNAFIKIFIALPSTALHAGPHVETSLCRDRGGGDIFHQLQMIHYRNLLPQFHTHKHMPIIVSSTNRKALVHDTTTVMHSYRIFNIKSSSITLNFVVSTA